MNNLLIQLAERDYREENLLKCKDNPDKKMDHKSIWDLITILPTIPGLELYYIKLLKN